MYRAKELNVDRREKQILSLTLRGVVENDPENPEGLVPSDYATYQIFERDDLVFKLIDLENLRTSRVGWVHRRGIMSSAYLRLRPRSGIDVRYFYWQFFDLYGRHVFNELGSGVRSTLGAEEVLELPLLIPPYEAQTAIVDYLDAETARIDALVAKKQRLVNLLEERKVGLAHEMITGSSIDCSTRRRTHEWLGAIPTDWPFAPVGSKYSVVLGRMLNPERTSGKDMKPYIRNANVRWDYVDVTDIAEMEFPLSERAKYALKVGDLLINEGGAGVGRSAIWQGALSECYFQKSVLRLRPIADARPEWMVECMRVAVAQNVLLVEGNLATIPHVPAEALRPMRFPFPPAEIQDALLAQLRSELNRDQEVNRNLQSQIGLLLERRQAVITAAVTGQLDIQELANGND
jgi:type I restriction enzyme S subunit